MNRSKQVILYFILFLFTLTMSEGLAQSMYRLWKGEFLWQTQTQGYNQSQEVFSVRDFITPVNDDRFFTAKPNVSFTPNGQWVLHTNEQGFRQDTAASSQANVVIMGDSVPFGWGVGDTDTVTAYLSELLARYQTETPWGVINGALPSYSLYQAIKRYEHELHGKYPAKVVILQTYDPVTQFEKFGRAWHKNINWFTQRWTDASTPVILRYSALYWLYQQSRYILIDQKQELQIDDEVAFARFEAENIASLDELYAMTQQDGASLVLLPVTAPSQRMKSKARLAAIDHLNQTLQQYAAQHEQVYYFDVRTQLYRFYNEEVFIDSCCHLSPLGAKHQAEFLLESLAAHDLIQVKEPATFTPTWPLGQLSDAINHLTTQAKPQEVIMGVTTTDYFHRLITPVRPDLIYFDSQDLRELDPQTLPGQLLGRWYVFYRIEHLPPTWQTSLQIKQFGDITLLYLPDMCQITTCFQQAQELLTELARLNPDSYLERKINEVLIELAPLVD